MRRIAILAALLSVVALRAADGDKNRLFNTFYLDGERISYVLVLREDRTFDLYGPDNNHVTGSLRASAEHLTLTSGDVKRMFHFDNRDHDLKLGTREGDRNQRGHLLGEMPPTQESVARTLWLSERTWLNRGRPQFQRPVGGVAPVIPRGEPPVAAPPPPVAPPARTTDSVPPPMADGSLNTVAGTYYLPAPNNKRELLVLSRDGNFEYQTADNVKATARVLLVDDELIVLGASHKRRFRVRSVPGGVELTRQETDVVKPSDLLGRMPPQDREPFVWLRTAGGAAPGPDAVAVPPPVAPPDVARAPEPAAPAAGGAVRELRGVVGSFTHKPNPFISETLIVAESGAFSYKDSNGASAEGTAAFSGEVLVLTAGDVIRRFRVTQEGTALLLTCDPDDAPKFKNDLASMSPTVLKKAKYEKK